LRIYARESCSQAFRVALDRIDRFVRDSESRLAGELGADLELRFKCLRGRHNASSNPDALPSPLDFSVFSLAATQRRSRTMAGGTSDSGSIGLRPVSGLTT
jgi:hypothetical protein